MIVQPYLALLVSSSSVETAWIFVGLRICEYFEIVLPYIIHFNLRNAECPGYYMSFSYFFNLIFLVVFDLFWHMLSYVFQFIL